MKKIILGILLLALMATIFWQNSQPLPRTESKSSSTLEELRAVYVQNNIHDELLFQLRGTPVISKWEETNREPFLKTFGQKKYDVLVVPFQTQHYGLDRIGRELISRHLIDSIEQSSQLKVAPFDLVRRYLGVYKQYTSIDDVQKLADELGVRYVIWGFAGVTDQFKSPEIEREFQLSVLLYQQGNGEPERKLIKDWKSKVSLSNSEYDFYRGIENELLDALSFTKRQSQPDSNYPLQTAVDFINRNLFEFDPTDLNPVERAYYYQTLGMLVPNITLFDRRNTPALSEYHSNTLFEKSLMQLSKIPTESPDYKLIKARAYIYLNRKNAALKVLESADSIEANAIRAVANADTQTLIKIKDQLSGIHLFFTQLELQHFRYFTDYLAQDENIRKILVAYPDNAYLIWRALKSNDGWAYFDNRDLYFAIQKSESSLNKSLKNSHIDPNDPEADFDQKSLVAFSTLFTNAMLGEDYEKDEYIYDLSLLVEGIFEANLLSQIYRETSIKGSLIGAEKSIAHMFPFYEGNPKFELAKLTVKQFKISKLATKEEQTVLQRTTFKEGVDILGLEIGQNPQTRMAGWITTEMHKSGVSDQKGQFISRKSYLKAVGDQFPATANFPNFHQNGEELELATAVAAVAPLQSLVRKNINEGKLDAAATILANNQDRFVGYEAKTSLEIELALAQNQGVEVINALKQRAISENSANFDHYFDLAMYSLNQGNIAKAREMLDSFPGFKNPDSIGRVKLSNLTSQAGSLFFWRGHILEAKKYFDMSIAQRTGSDQEMLAEQRLHILDQNYPEALQSSIKRYSRYQNRYAARDVIALASLLEQDEIAESVFIKELEQNNSPNIWIAINAYHRSKSWSRNDTESWLNALYDKYPETRKGALISRYAFLSLMDRETQDIDANFVGRYDDTSGYTNKEDGIWSHHGVQVASAKRFNWSENCDQEKQASIYPSLDKLFSKVYISVKNKRYDDAYAALLNAGCQYDLTANTAWPLIPYAAIAAAETGHSNQLSSFIEHTVERIPDLKNGVTKYFDLEIAKSVIAAKQGNFGLAKETIQRALDIKPYTDWRQLDSFYQLLEIYEWLYEKSNDMAFIHEGLRIARIWKTVQPYYSWPYAFIARYSKIRAEREEATAVVKRLDKQSAWLKDALAQ